MLRQILKSKIHRAKITDTKLKYKGSITIDEQLLELADLLPNEKVHVLNMNNGARLETYIIVGERNTGEICLNGAAARLAQEGDEIIIVAYALMETEEALNFQPKIVFVDENNKPRE